MSVLSSGAEMDIRCFDPDGEAREEFLDLQLRLRASDPRWLPPSRAEQTRLLSPLNAFFRHGEMACFLASDGGRNVGRCAAIWDRGQQHESQPIGQIGFFECEDDPAAARALVDAASEWLRQRGLRRVWGPMDFSIWHSYRFMTK